MPDDRDIIENDEWDASLLPKPEKCGYECTLGSCELRVTLRSTFDRENAGKSWAKDIVNAYRLPLQRVVVDFHRCNVVSSTVFAGLVELHQGFQNNATDGVVLEQVGKQVIMSLRMLQFDKMFTIHMRGGAGS